MQRLYSWAQIAILAGTSLYLAVTLAAGRITNYIAARFTWLAWLAAALLLSMALLRARDALRPAHNHTHGGEHSHFHAGGRGFAAWAGLGIAALPALLGFLVPSAPLDSRAIDRPISRDLGSLPVSPGKTIQIAPDERSVLDWLRAFSSAVDPSEFAGQPADVIGFVHRDTRLTDPDQFMVARFVISCCVADAQAIALTAEWSGGSALPEDTWVRVRGTFQLRLIDGESVPVLIAEPGAPGVTVVERPEHPYLYP